PAGAAAPHRALAVRRDLVSGAGARLHPLRLHGGWGTRPAGARLPSPLLAERNHQGRRPSVNGPPQPTVKLCSRGNTQRLDGARRASRLWSDEMARLAEIRTTLSGFGRQPGTFAANYPRNPRKLFVAPDVLGQIPNGGRRMLRRLYLLGLTGL